ncbi:4-hydroxy-tetrahydrodipicolinate synthase [Tunturiibacter gelidiferens]|uniref:4-hydroxy-tetrahydrodipicolinate synthase n=1 Tax=Tunturiibacter gelidiferens TaxID=3069689 RepID=UPI003D9BBB9D
MMSLQKTFLRGSFPPLITPFRGGKVDYEKFAELVERQVLQGSHGIVVAGTTGEPSSLSVEERTELLKVAISVIAGRIQVVAATGSQSFTETAQLTAQAEQAGADAALVVTPYYIKPSQRGLIDYFVTLGQRTRLPLMIYHIPGRAAVSIKAQTVIAIAEQLPHLVGLKHADQNLELLTELLIGLGPEFRIFCGVEALSLPMLLLGGSGLMNAVGNLAPARVAALYAAVQQVDLARAREIHVELFELNQSIFIDTNPVPLKYMMSRLGLLDSPELRLPLVSLAQANEPILDSVLQRSGLLEPSHASVP